MHPEVPKVLFDRRLVRYSIVLGYTYHPIDSIHRTKGTISLQSNSLCAILVLSMASAIPGTNSISLFVFKMFKKRYTGLFLVYHQLCLSSHFMSPGSLLSGSRFWNQVTPDSHSFETIRVTPSRIGEEGVIKRSLQSE